MNHSDLEKLLGGYMTGTLTEAENSALMRAALDDQQLFDAMADGEALRDALADPVFRARLRARLGSEAAPPQRSLRWLWMLAPVMAAGLALVFILNRPEPHRTFETASVKTPQAVAPAPLPSESRPSGNSAASSAPAPPAPVPQVAQRRSSPAQQPPPPPPPPQAASEPPPAPPPVQLGRVSEAVTVTAEAPILSAEKKTTVSKDEAAPPAAARAPELHKSAAETDALVAAALELQVERSTNGRFESTELGALRQGDRVRFRVRVPEPGTLVMTAGADVARSTLAEPGRTYYLPDANGLPPGDAPLQVAIALHPNIEGERGNTLFRARQAAADKPAASALGGAAPAAAPPPAAPMRDTRREDSAKAKEQAAPKQEAAVGRLSQSANQVAPPSSPRTVVLNLEFKPR